MSCRARDQDQDQCKEDVQKKEEKMPNILITGTPGTGKTTTAQLLFSALKENLKFKLFSIGEIVKEKSLHEGFDEEFQSYLIDEDRVLDELEQDMELGGVIVDHHSCAFFPERWFDLVVVLTCDNTILYDRLASRNYKDNKIQENVQCEIMHVVLEEARESYKEEIIAILPSNNLEEMQSNVERIEEWIELFRH